MKQMTCGAWVPTVASAKGHEAHCETCQIIDLKEQLRASTNALANSATSGAVNVLRMVARKPGYYLTGVLYSEHADCLNELADSIEAGRVKLEL